MLPDPATLAGYEGWKTLPFDQIGEKVSGTVEVNGGRSKISENNLKIRFGTSSPSVGLLENAHFVEKSLPAPRNSPSRAIIRSGGASIREVPGRKHMRERRYLATTLIPGPIRCGILAGVLLGWVGL